jgi:hypothetical protein
MTGLTDMQSPMVQSITTTNAADTQATSRYHSSAERIVETTQHLNPHPASNPFYLGDLGGIDDDLSNYLLTQQSLTDYGRVTPGIEITNDDLDEATDDLDTPILYDADCMPPPPPPQRASAIATTTVNPSLIEDPDNIEYLRFLESLMAPADLPATNAMINDNYMIDEEDCEFTADAHLLNDQSEEFRRDRNAIISKREYQELVMDVGSDDDDEAIGAPRGSLASCYARSDGYLFTMDQLQLLRRQQENNLQLLLQSYTVERQMRGESNNEILDHWRHQIMALVRLREQSTIEPGTEDGERTVAFPSLHNTIGIDVAFEWITAPLPQGEDDLQFVRDMGKPVRRRRIPVGKDGDKARFFWEAHANKPLCLPKSLQELNRAFATIFEKALVPRIICGN